MRPYYHVSREVSTSFSWSSVWFFCSRRSSDVTGWADWSVHVFQTFRLWRIRESNKYRTGSNDYESLLHPKHLYRFRSGVRLYSSLDIRSTRVTSYSFRTGRFVYRYFSKTNGIPQYQTRGLKDDGVSCGRLSRPLRKMLCYAREKPSALGI